MQQRTVVLSVWCQHYVGCGVCNSACTGQDVDLERDSLADYRHYSLLLLISYKRAQNVEQITLIISGITIAAHATTRLEQVT